MKKKLLLIILTIMLAVCGMALTACNNESQSNGNNTDETNTIQNGIQFNTLTLNADNTVYGKVANGTTTFSFLDEIETIGTANYGVYLDIYCTQEAKSKTVPLKAKENTFYIFAENTDKGEILYTVKIKIKSLFQVSFDALNDGEIVKQTVEEDSFAIAPFIAPQKLGCDFDGWDFDFENTKITKNTVITAKWKDNVEMSNFTFKSTVSTCEITGVKDKNLYQIVIPSFITSISTNAFQQSYKLVEVINKSKLNISVGSWSNGFVGRSAIQILKSEPQSTNFIENDNYVFYNHNGTYYLIDYIGNETTLNLPTNINGNNYSIYDYAFSNRNLVNVSIPSGVTSIGDYIFNNCQRLENLEISDDIMSIGSLFSSTADFPNLKCNEYGNGLYLGNADNPYFIFFRAKDRGYSSFEINDKCKIIFSIAFASCYNLQTIEIGDNVEIIDSGAFSGCNKLKKITLGKNVKEISSNAFNECYKLVEVINQSNITISKGLYGLDALLNVYENESQSGGFVEKDSYQFYNSNGTYYLLEYKGNQTNLILPSDINGNEYTIFDYAFYNKPIKSVEIPNKVVSIRKNAFYCTYLENLVVLNTNIIAEENAFYGVNLKTATLPTQLMPHIANEYLETVVLNGGDAIADKAFYECRRLKSVTIPDTVKSIGNYAFYLCDDLKTLIIPNGVKSIGNYAFAMCSELSTLVYPVSLEEVGENAIQYTNVLKKIYYMGTSTEWASININPIDGKGGFTTSVYYYAEMRPQSSGAYWHYVDGVVTEW